MTNRCSRLATMDLLLMPARTAVSIEKARRLLGFTPQTSFDAGDGGL